MASECLFPGPRLRSLLAEELREVDQPQPAGERITDVASAMYIISQAPTSVLSLPATMPTFCVSPRQIDLRSDCKGANSLRVTAHGYLGAKGLEIVFTQLGLVLV